ncbi:ubiquitin carboxyl-terminal hydrolase 1 isoform X2 [Plutella xylostella]|uniref:ubiquitin carboxyl-terminal hydrolase 1 isoform X2 n=1 Tax=Plutella xylostella TaxID=51655 RepID=UPI002032EC0B|nr:ubiquitin carboxyl-terminal hydrolase 1 isoform X2 [Plutella xylostella]
MKSSRQEFCSDKENRPAKRPFSSTYMNTLNNSKKLKAVTGTSNSTKSSNLELVIVDTPAERSSLAMLNGHHQSENSYNGTATTKKTPVATLSNLGNTCFLNSVLYTLRYAPSFLHNLHHLVSDLASVEQKLGSIRLKSSSLGRSAAGLAASGTRSWSSKDLLSLGQSENSNGKSKIQIATERLHETFSSLRAAEARSLASGAAEPEPYAADAFLCALRDVNSTFEGNKQQDAHELLICILNNIRETSRALTTRASKLQVHENGDSNGITRQPSLEGGKGGAARKSWKRRKEPAEPRPDPPPSGDFVADDFEGTMVVRTTCLECETARAHAQAVCDVGVPVAESGDEPDPFAAAAQSHEYLRDQNKYWCSVCLRYVEARRCVSYSRLPRILVLQLKRFSGGMTKITRHAPTPLRLPCFCEPCTAADKAPQHRYKLFAVIMHLGQSLSGGHYVAYARDSADDTRCEREAPDPAAAATGSSFMRTLFNRPKPPQTGCAAKDCCVPRPKEPCWLSCDDELVKPITDEEFEDLLSAEPKTRSAATPYLLFYVKTDVG